MKIRTILGASGLLFGSVANSAIISVTDPIFGADSVTQDTVSGLDWLDVNLSVNRSYIDVSTQFGIGGDYEGWRYATVQECVHSRSQQPIKRQEENEQIFIKCAKNTTGYCRSYFTSRVFRGY